MLDRREDPAADATGQPAPVQSRMFANFLNERGEQNVAGANDDALAWWKDHARALEEARARDKRALLELREKWSEAPSTANRELARQGQLFCPSSEFSVILYPLRGCDVHVQTRPERK